MNRKNTIFISLLLLGMAVYANSFGSAGAAIDREFNLEEMLQYALEDEHMALAEYEALMEEFGLTRPYSNIAKSEETHIAYLEELYENNNIEIPRIDADDHLVLPSTIREAAEIGVQAEINNIAMYEKFLKEDLPDDVKEVFQFLMRASENHLNAFERQLSRLR